MATPAPSEEGLGSSAAAQSPNPTPSAPQGALATGAPPSNAKEVCEQFNALYAEYAALEGADAAGFEEIYREAGTAREAVAGSSEAGDLEGLFAALGLLAIDRSSAAGSGGQPEQASKDAVRDAVFANAGTCTEAGVTLQL